VIITNISSKKNYDVTFKRSSGDEYLPCPECSLDRKKKNAKSLSFSHNKGVGKCHHCDAKFIDPARKEQAPQVKKEYVKPKFTNATSLSEKVVGWFKSRGIGQQVLIDFKITEGKSWMPQTGKEENTIQFNYFRDNGLVNVKYRDGRKNFKLHKDAELIFYNFDAIEAAIHSDKKEIVIVEGEIDCLSWSEVGINNVISVPNGATKGNSKMEYLDSSWELFEQLDRVYLATDDDEAGRMLREELARRIGKEKCFIVSFDGQKDSNDLLKNDRLQLLECLKKATPYPIEGIYSPKDYLQKLKDLKLNGLKGGDRISIEQFNKCLTFVTGYITLITGIPNHGKGEFLDQIMVDLAHLYQWSFGIFSPENYPIELHISKLLSKVYCKPFNAITEKEIEYFNTARDDIEKAINDKKTVFD
jgi:twinkle protein